MAHPHFRTKSQFPNDQTSYQLEQAELQPQQQQRERGQKSIERRSMAVTSAVKLDSSRFHDDEYTRACFSLSESSFRLAPCKHKNALVFGRIHYSLSLSSLSPSTPLVCVFFLTQHNKPMSGKPSNGPVTRGTRKTSRRGVRSAKVSAGGLSTPRHCVEADLIY